MLTLDSLTLQYFYEENHDFINGAIVQKIQLPSRYEIILNLRNLNIKDEKPQNKKLYININPKYPHICFIDEESIYKRNIEIPKIAPMFCMQLRKYISGSKIKDFRVVKYERIVEFYFDYFDEIGSSTSICLCVELMGKHSNIILYNAQNKIIIGSIHNISSQKSSIREIYGGMKYFYPPQKQKLDILNISYSTFFEIAKDFDIKEISNNFYYFSQNILSQILKDKNKDELNDIFNFMQSLQGNKTGQNKKFMIDFWTKSKNITTNNIITINGAIDDYTKEVLFDEIMKEKKLKLQKYLSNDIKKLSKIVSINLEDKSINLKKSADIIMNNLYKINPNDTELVEGDYKIALDKNLNPIQNANKYYELYKKAKTAFEYNKKRTLEAKEKLSYFNDILFNIENSKDFLELKEIKNELIDLGYIEEKKETLKQPSVLKENFEGYDIYIGKNGIQNNYLISNIASDNDLWFHAKDCPSAHIILKIPKGKIEPNKEVLEYCSKLAKQNSKAKDSTKASIIMTKRKYLKKPPNTYPGFVTYKNEVEIII